MAKVYFYTEDPILDFVYDKEEAVDMFGDDWVVECFVDIPDELLLRYKKNMKELYKIQNELKKIKKS